MSKKNKDIDEEKNINETAAEEEEYVTSTAAADILADVLADEKAGKADAETKEPEEDDDTDDGEDKPKRRSEHKKLKHGFMSTVYTIVFITVVVLINTIATIIFDRYPITIDLTKNSKYSISEESEEYIKSIDVDVTIRIFATEDAFIAINDYTKQANEVVKKYCRYNDRISVEYIDVDSNPNIVSEYSDQEVSAYSIVVETLSRDENGNVMMDGEKELKRVRTVSLLDMIDINDDFEQQVSESYYGMSAVDYLISYAGGDELTAFAIAVQSGIVEYSTADQAFISAIMSVTDPDPVVVSVLTGRNEATDISYYKNLLVANGYTVNEVNIASEEIPEDTDLCIIPSPSVDYMEADITKVDNFLNNDGKMGKNLIYIASVYQQETPNLDEFLAEYYIAVGNGMIWESDTEHYYYSSPYITISDDISDSFADTVPDDAKLIIEMARPVKLLTDEKGNIATEAYVQSTDNAVLMNTTTGEAIEYGKQIYAGMASKVSFSGEDSLPVYSNILVLGSDSIVSDQYMRTSQYQNREYILSVTNGMTGKNTTGITIEPKVIEGNIFDITADQVKLLKRVFIGVIPAATLILGFVIWLRRKHR